ncbi:hypothetical protein BDZ89DRAFT_1157391 [Hymenopellis radicata]|nr:hypothetical protein BDZ89DRAFT_1157391 [Hymenopellis radicata]
MAKFKKRNLSRGGLKPSAHIYPYFIDSPPYYHVPYSSSIQCGRTLPPTPAYTVSPLSSEVSVKGEALTGSPSSAHFTYRTQHMTIDLGPRIWGSSYPCYGLNGRVEGSIRFSGMPRHVKRVSVTLMARLATSAPQRGVKGKYVSTLMSRTIPVYVPFKTGTSWEDDHHFSIPIPSEINMHDAVSELPPSFSSWDTYLGVGCDLAYFLKVCMLCKRNGISTHESRLIPIMYFPKSQPSQVGLPEEVSYSGDASLEGPESDEDSLKMDAVLPRWPSSVKPDSETSAQFSETISISLPYTTFASGELIPFTIKICSAQPSLSHILCQSTCVTLLKRITVSPSSGKACQTAVTNLSTGSFTTQEAKDGSYVLSGNVRAGKAGKEASWSIPDTVSAEYILRVSVVVPKNLAGHIPNFRHEKVVKLTSDPCGTIERELRATGGVPTPALGLQSALPRDDVGSFANVYIC